MAGYIPTLPTESNSLDCPVRAPSGDSNPACARKLRPGGVQVATATGRVAEPALAEKSANPYIFQTERPRRRLITFGYCASLTKNDNLYFERLRQGNPIAMFGFTLRGDFL